MEEASFEKIGVYIKKKQNTAAQYIAMQPIMNNYKQCVRRPVAWVSRRWWVQEGVDLGDTRDIVVEASDEEENKRGE